MTSWKDFPITRRADGSYVIAYAGFPEYHVPNNEEFAALWAQVNSWANEHPEQVTDEPAPPEPTDEELLERAKSLKAAEFDEIMAETDARLARPTADLLAALIDPAPLADDDSSAAADLEESRRIFAALRALQAENRERRTQALSATSVAAVQAITPKISFDGEE